MPNSAAAPVVAVPSSAWPPGAVVWLLAVTVVAAALRLAGLAAWSYDAAEAVGWRAVTTPPTAPGGAFDGPLRPAPLGWLALHALAELGWLPTRGEGWLRLPAALCGVLAAPLLAVVARPVLGLAGAAVGALFLAVHPAAIAASQSLSPVAMAVVLALLAVAAWSRGQVALGVVGVALAAATSPGAWGLLLAGALLRTPPERQRVVAAVVGASAALLGAATLGASAVPLLAFAACGWPLAPRRVRLVVGAATLGAATAALAAGEAGRTAASFAIPFLAGLAGFGAWNLRAVLLQHLAGARWFVAVAAAMPIVVPLAWLGVDAFLQATVHRGARTPWRSAAERLWAAAKGDPGLVVAAGRGAASLGVYLRPTPDSAIDVAAIDAAAGAEPLAALAARPEQTVYLVLRADELDQLGDAGRRALAAAFVCTAVVPSPQLHGDDSVSIFLRRTPPADGPR